MWKRIKNFLLSIFFPQFCFNCRKEGDFLCEDCQALLGVSGFHKAYPSGCLKDLYFPLAYQNPLVKNLIRQFKYEPFIKELDMTLASLIITHFELLDNKPDFSDFVLLAVPLEKRRLKWRGFNQSQEIAKELGSFWQISIVSNCLIKTKKTPTQVELDDALRKTNTQGVFFCQNPRMIQGKKILLVDDVYTTGSTMQECAWVLKIAGAKEVRGVVVARG